MRSASSRCQFVRPGGVTPLALLSVALLVGVAALTIDGGGMLEERRHLQAAADAAALAAATDLFSNYSTCKGLDTPGTAQASALATAQANGYANDGTQSIVTVCCSPQTYQGGPSAGQVIPAGYVEVTIQSHVSRTFSAVFGTGSVAIQARAVARGLWEPVDYTVMALSLSVKPSNTQNVNLNIHGDIWINSTATTPVPDPLRFLPVPDPVQLHLATQSGGSSFAGNSIVDLYPGAYPNGISVTGNATVVLHANSDKTPGIYYLSGGLNISGTATVTTAAGETGVMLYNNGSGNGGSINVGGSGRLLLTPPLSGAYQGMSIFQARGSSTRSGPQIVLGGSSVSVTGTIYAPYANVYLGSHSGGGLLGQVISDTMSLVVDGSNSLGGTTPLANARNVGLVE